MSIVWEFFEISQDDPSKVVCILCRTCLSRGGREARNYNTTNMIAHLKKVHNEEYLGAKERRNSELAVPVPTIKHPNSVEHSTTPNKRKCYAASKAKTDANAEEFKRLIAEMIIVDLHPISFVEGVGFRRLLDFVYPGCEVPSQDCLKDLIDLHIHERISSAVNFQVKQLDYLSLSIDILDLGVAGEPAFLTISAQGMTSTFNPLSFLLNVLPIPSSYSSTFGLKDPIMDCLEKFDVPFNRVHLVVCTDEALILEVQKTRLKSFHSFSHALQKMVYDVVFRRKFIKDLISKVQHAVFLKNRGCPPKFEPEKKHYGLSLPSLIQLVIELLEQFRALFNTEQVRPKPHGLNMSKRELRASKQLVVLLKPFDQVIKETLSHNSLLSYLIPAVRSLQLFFKRASSSEYKYFDCLKFVVRDLKVALQTTFESIFFNNDMCLATYLDPRFKRNLSLNSNFINVRSSIMEELSTLEEREEFESLSLSESMGEDMKEENDGIQQDFPCFDQFFDAVLLGTDLEEATQSGGTDNLQIKSEFDITPEESALNEFTPNMLAIDKELEVYESSGLIPSTEDPIVWWQNTCIIFPNLSKLARKYLSCTSSSTNHRRISDTQLSLLQNRTLPADIEKLLFMRQNLIMMDFQY